MSNAVLECRDLVKYFDEGPERVEVLKSVNFTLQKGELAAIIGNSGSGKTTLLHLLSGLDVPSSGEVLINGRDRSEEHTSELQSRENLVCRLLLEKNKH